MGSIAVDELKSSEVQHPEEVIRDVSDVLFVIVLVCVRRGHKIRPEGLEVMADVLPGEDRNNPGLEEPEGQVSIALSVELVDPRIEEITEGPVLPCLGGGSVINEVSKVHVVPPFLGWRGSPKTDRD